MIEVEKKFVLHHDEQERLLAGALFISEKTFTDEYFDTSEYDLAKKDWWLRFRDGRGELKIPSAIQSEFHLDQREEILDEKEIASRLGFSQEEDLRASLSRSEYLTICAITTCRRTYRDGDFRIDIDSATYNDGQTYAVAEVELLVETPEQGALAAQRIIDYAASKSLRDRLVRGKILEYLFAKHPDVYRMLTPADV